MNWPNELPQSPLIRGFSRNQRANRETFDPDGGKTTAIVFYTAVPDVLSVQFYMTQEQRDIFRNFYRVDTKWGTQKFNFTDPNTSTTVEARFIGRPPQERSVAGRDYIISFDLEILP